MRKLRRWVEFLSWGAVVVGSLVAWWDLTEAHKQHRLDEAKRVYREVDERYCDFLKLALDHPTLDCFSNPLDGGHYMPTGEVQKAEQALLFTYLSDVFEVAFVSYQKHQEREQIQEIKELNADQWSGWENYIKKFLARDTYRTNWYQIRSEYDAKFIAYMDGLCRTNGYMK